MRETFQLSTVSYVVASLMLAAAWTQRRAGYVRAVTDYARNVARAIEVQRVPLQLTDAEVESITARWAGAA